MSKPIHEYEVSYVFHGVRYFSVQRAYSEKQAAFFMKKAMNHWKVFDVRVVRVDNSDQYEQLVLQF